VLYSFFGGGFRGHQGSSSRALKKEKRTKRGGVVRWGKKGKKGKLGDVDQEIIKAKIMQCLYALCDMRKETWQVVRPLAGFHER